MPLLERMDETAHRKSLLGEFLSTRRAQLKPADVDLPDYGDRRRVPGLRREEVAQLAGVSVAYCIRLEQGLSFNASPQVLDALATALRLDDAERHHLHTLSGEPRRARLDRRASRTGQPRSGIHSAQHRPVDLPGRPHAGPVRGLAGRTAYVLSGGLADLLAGKPNDGFTLTPVRTG